MPRSIKNKIAICATVVLAALLTPLLLGIRRGAPWIPSASPAEDHRVVHPKGFSIVPPPGWVVKVSADSIYMDPGSKGMRYAPGLRIARLDSNISPDLLGFHETTFQQMSAYEMVRPVSGGGDVPYLRYHLFFKHNEHWYELFFVLPNGSFENPNRSEVPEMMMRYIRSFRPVT